MHVHNSFVHEVPCLPFWATDSLFQNSHIWNRVEQYKPIFIEPKMKAEFNTAMDNFYSKINDNTSNGAIFAAVCRGKVRKIFFTC